VLIIIKAIVKAMQMGMLKINQKITIIKEKQIRINLKNSKKQMKIQQNTK
jgi:hypothetical protein